MLYINVVRAAGNMEAAYVSDRENTAKHPGFTESRNDWHTFDEAKKIAALLGSDYIATDAGSHVSPRYDVIKLPKVGDKVSYAFNGDYYPCGEVASISKSLRLITTTEGQKFYRVRETGAWKYNQTWSLVPGHVSRLNPEF